MQPFPLVLTTGNDQPFDNVGFNWNRVFGSSMVNELLVGFSNTQGDQQHGGLGGHR